MEAEPADPAAEFRRFLRTWLSTNGMSQFELARVARIGQANISHWVATDPDRQTDPKPESLKLLAPVVGRDYDDLMRMAGYSAGKPQPRPTDLPAELAALMIDLEAGWRAADSTTRRIGEQVVRAAFHLPRRRRPRTTEGQDQEAESDSFAPNYALTNASYA